MLQNHEIDLGANILFVSHSRSSAVDFTIDTVNTKVPLYVKKGLYTGTTIAALVNKDTWTVALVLLSAAAICTVAVNSISNSENTGKLQRFNL